MSGRVLAFTASFLHPRGPGARSSTRPSSATYKQLFLVSTTLYAVGQLGDGREPLLLPAPRPGQAGRYVANAALASWRRAAPACLALLVCREPAIARGLNNAGAAAEHLPLLGRVPALMLAYGVARDRDDRPRSAIARARWSLRGVSTWRAAALLVIPAVLVPGLGWLLLGRGGLRGAPAARPPPATSGWEFGAALRPDGALLRRPARATRCRSSRARRLEIAAGTHSTSTWWPHRFDAATFAVYPVGCLQIPLRGACGTASVLNVMMVRMAERDPRGPRPEAAVACGTHAARTLALVFFPAGAAARGGARPDRRSCSPSATRQRAGVHGLLARPARCRCCAVDAVLRVYAETRALLWPAGGPPRAHRAPHRLVHRRARPARRDARHGARGGRGEAPRPPAHRAAPRRAVSPRAALGRPRADPRRRRSARACRRWPCGPGSTVAGVRRSRPPGPRSGRRYGALLLALGAAHAEERAALARPWRRRRRAPRR